MPFHKRKEWSGPKEWRPKLPERWVDSPILSPEENRKIRALFFAAKNETISSTEATWLYRMVDKLSHCGPDDYAFPGDLALYNTIANAAYAMRYLETCLIESYRFTTFLGAILLDHVISVSNPCEATMLIRPYVKVNSPADPALVLSLRRSEISMEVDGEKALRTPVDEHLIFEDGSFPRKNRWKARQLPNQSLFFAVPLDSECKAHVADPEGIFCPNGSRIIVSLIRNEFAGEISLTTGLVAAKYTTKGARRPIEGNYSPMIVP